MIHNLKTVQPYFDRVKSGEKTCEFRFNDRDFQVGDSLILEEYDPINNVYSGSTIKARITHILNEFKGIEKGYCMISIADATF